jgi:peptide/nickel transport system permease protein
MSQNFLWTDKFFLGILLFCLILIGRGLRKEHIRRAFLSIFKNPIAVSAGILLLLFLIIAVLDSIHLTTPSTLLDRALAPLGGVYEKTYSAPFALTLYSSETTLVKGHAEQVYPRLIYPPNTIKNSRDVWNLVRSLALKAFLSSAGMVACIWLVAMGYRLVRYRVIDLSVSARGGSALLTLFICVMFMLASFWLSREFHILGTGKIGQDIFYYAIKSIRTGLIIGMVTTLFMMPLALFLGIAAGYFGGIIDDIIQYIYTTLSSIPGVLLITASVLSMQTYIANHPQRFTTLEAGADARLLALCFILGVTSWTSLCRLLRAEALKLREIDFVLAAKALGSRSFKIICKHLLPNVMHIVVISLVLDFSFLVLAEAVLSYVGVGVSPMTISWGNMINEARLELAREPLIWWPMIAAFMFMFTLVLASNLFADAVRDAFDPHQAR